MKWRRVLPTIRFGTERYPEKVARHLRVVNATAFALVAISLGFVVAHMINPNPGLWPPSLVHLGAALGFSAVPLMHRWGPSLGASLLIAVGLADISGLCLIFGTGSGLHFWALLVPALLIPFYGKIRLPVAVALVVLAATVTIVLEAVTPVNTGLRPPHQVFIANFIPSVVLSFAILFSIVLYAIRQIAHAEAAAEHEFERSEALIANILPVSVAARLKESGGEVIADRYDQASVLFADMEGFTARASDTEPEDLVRFLNDVFSDLDTLVEKHGLEKIKTTGDAYMVVSGVPEPRPDQVEALSDLALEMRDALADLVDPKGRAVPFRIGIASGPVVAGVVGRQKFFYDVWGDAVNMAARMEQTGEPGQIQVTSDVHERLKNRFIFVERGLIEVRGKGMTRTWLLNERKSG
ncbi:adenylate/guanylate cyclase domain-containing protein [Ruegeria meonggei]|uniref:adenylate/guanylate cyclase domain-containing protein n=1 Tax=Ruegeria meonggei TaxID=1446476 RepID=UPI00366ECCB2